MDANDVKAELLKGNPARLPWWYPVSTFKARSGTAWLTLHVKRLKDGTFLVSISSKQGKRRIRDVELFKSKDIFKLIQFLEDRLGITLSYYSTT